MEKLSIKKVVVLGIVTLIIVSFAVIFNNCGSCS